MKCNFCNKKFTTKCYYKISDKKMNCVWYHICSNCADLYKRIAEENKRHNLSTIHRIHSIMRDFRTEKLTLEKVIRE